jgi:uncharacterized protein (DUF1499 family)
MERPSRVAAAARIAGLLGIVLFALGPLSVQLGTASAFVGFRIFGIGLLSGLVALVLGAVGLVKTRAATGRPGRASALTGLLLGAVPVACVVVAAAPARDLPAINDITTDTADPPAFANPARTYPGEEFAQKQRAAYPDLAPIRFPSPPEAAFASSLSAARGLGWEIVREDAGAGLIEATDTTEVFRFVDDVVIRVRPAGDGSTVDVRSKSRDGRGDLGANAARIRAFRERLASSSTP